MKDDTNIQKYEGLFACYAQDFCQQERASAHGDDGPMLLKIDHTARVLAHARRIVQAEGFAPVVARACLLAALFHDTARFYQYYIWRTFKDSLSVNHGLMGVKILKKQQWLREESPQVRALVLTAVGMHNRFALPAVLPDAVRTVTDVVRDADKLDIFHIMAGHLQGEKPYDTTVVLSVADDPALWTAQVVQDCLNGRVASYADLHSINDLRLLLGTWVDDVRFAATKKALVDSGLVPLLLSALPDIPEVQAAKSTILRRLDGLRQSLAQGAFTGTMPQSMDAHG